MVILTAKSTFSRALEWPFPSKVVSINFQANKNNNVWATCVSLLPNHYHGHPDTNISRVFGNCIVLDNALGKALNLAVRVAWVWEECDQLHMHTVLLLTKVIYTAMSEIARTSHGKHREEVRVFDRISSLPCLVMSVQSISTNKYVTVVIIKQNSLYGPHILVLHLCREMQNKPV